MTQFSLYVHKSGLYKARLLHFLLLESQIKTSSSSYPFVIPLTVPRPLETLVLIIS